MSNIPHTPPLPVSARFARYFHFLCPYLVLYLGRRLPMSGYNLFSQTQGVLLLLAAVHTLAVVWKVAAVPSTAVGGAAPAVLRALLVIAVVQSFESPAVWSGASVLLQL